jgi:hypothetical protein
MLTFDAAGAVGDGLPANGSLHCCAEPSQLLTTFRKNPDIRAPLNGWRAPFHD